MPGQGGFTLYPHDKTGLFLMRESVPNEVALARFHCKTRKEDRQRVLIRGFLQRPSTTQGGSAERFTTTLITHTRVHTGMVVKNSLEIMIKQVRLEGGFKRMCLQSSHIQQTRIERSEVSWGLLKNNNFMTLKCYLSPELTWCLDTETENVGVKKTKDARNYMEYDILLKHQHKHARG